MTLPSLVALTEISKNMLERVRGLEAEVVALRVQLKELAKVAGRSGGQDTWIYQDNVNNYLARAQVRAQMPSNDPIYPNQGIAHVVLEQENPIGTLKSKARLLCDPAAKNFVCEFYDTASSSWRQAFNVDYNDTNNPATLFDGTLTPSLAETADLGSTSSLWRRILGLNIALNVVTKTANYTATTSDMLILVNAIAGARTITLPAASNKGTILCIKRINAGTNNVTIQRGGSDTIEGATSITLTAQYQYRLLQADGASTWYILANP